MKRNFMEYIVLSEYLYNQIQAIPYKFTHDIAAARNKVTIQIEDLSKYSKRDIKKIYEIIDQKFNSNDPITIEFLSPICVKKTHIDKTNCKECEHFLKRHSRCRILQSNFYGRFLYFTLLDFLSRNEVKDLWYKAKEKGGKL